MAAARLQGGVYIPSDPISRQSWGIFGNHKKIPKAYSGIQECPACRESRSARNSSIEARVGRLQAGGRAGKEGNERAKLTNLGRVGTEGPGMRQAMLALGKGIVAGQGRLDEELEEKRKDLHTGTESEREKAVRCDGAAWAAADAAVMAHWWPRGAGGGGGAVGG